MFRLRDLILVYLRVCGGAECLKKKRRDTAEEKVYEKIRSHHRVQRGIGRRRGQMEGLLGFATKSFVFARAKAAAASLTLLSYLVLLQGSLVTAAFPWIRRTTSTRV